MQIHPDTASSLGLSDGQWVWLEGPVGDMGRTARVKRSCSTTVGAPAATPASATPSDKLSPFQPPRPSAFRPPPSRREDSRRCCERHRAASRFLLAWQRYSCLYIPTLDPAPTNQREIPGPQCLKRQEKHPSRHYRRRLACH
ncbi:hypothetical protein DMP10_07485 [Adlercreutzia equolifaciens subsp. celatus DSM 18785]|uniref:Uncharacterized protein n=1 Tax=Adlercreutzia equolifaciens subsp. celatus DSM 18785 TaxID=1121021 RepID=A0A3N0ART3_9ACTN|nr:hypothetical protein DX904_08330 [Adlercreutzia equolifaciens subsp. celatus]RNL37535.1 hypothetical protein DMP10_07485 [Adlercreutzia equolifaciens subsp. celatus DSM 18785]